MKQILLNYLNGRLSTEEVPTPFCKDNGVLVANACSAISPGTERSVVHIAKSSFLQKARQRPEQVKQVLQNVRQEGLIPTFKKVMTRLDSLSPLGYCSSGTIIKVGKKITKFRIGNRVVCAGEGIGSHAEIVFAPELLCYPIPDGMSFDHAAFSPLVAIALQALRQSECRLGERVVVIGLGLLGLISIQLLKTSGCHVMGIDIDKNRCDLALQFGAERSVLSSEMTLEEQVRDFSQGYGVDAVLVMASTSSAEPLELAGKFCREKGRVVVAGLLPLEFPRKEYWAKELSLTMSRSFGPGYYDPRYASDGQDYPFGYVRWSAGRNIEEAIHLIHTQKINLDPLITHHFPVQESEKAYALLNESSEVLGAVFEYEQKPGSVPHIVLPTKTKEISHDKNLKIGWIGAGNFAQAYLIPAFKRLESLSFHTIANTSSVSSANIQRKFGFMKATCDTTEVITSEEINCVVITSRHDSHAPLASEMLDRNKHVFVEKPLALTVSDLKKVVASARMSKARIFVGFNRRFAPLVIWLNSFIRENRSPRMIQYRINAGPVPAEHWVRHPEQGGGRILGEVCHFVDLCHYLIGHPPLSVHAQALPGLSGEKNEEDSIIVNLQFTDGSLAQILYSGIGDPSFPRERLEISAPGVIGVIDNFKTALLSQKGKRRTRRLWARDMGYKNEVEAFVNALQSGTSSLPTIEEYALSTLATIKIIESLHLGKAVAIQPGEVLT